MRAGQDWAAGQGKEGKKRLPILQCRATPNSQQAFSPPDDVLQSGKKKGELQKYPINVGFSALLFETGSPSFVLFWQWSVQGR